MNTMADTTYTYDPQLEWSLSDIKISSGTLDTSDTYIISDSTADTISLGDYTFQGFGYGNNQSLNVQGDANFEGDIKIKGKSLTESIAQIEEKLAILHPNVELEEKWEQLRNLRKQYMELENEILNKEKVWSILKK